MQDNTLMNIQHFFVVDNMIKRIMWDSRPPLEYQDRRTIKKYTDVLDDNLKYVFTELKCICLDFFGIDSPMYNKVTMMEKTIRYKMAHCGFDIDRLKAFYQVEIGRLDSNFLDAVKDECIGYSLRSINKSMNMAYSINEILHLIHSYIVNNHHLLRSIQPNNVKKNDIDMDVSLRGYDSMYFNSLFDSIPSDLDTDEIDMVVLDDNNALMMIRARGHALTIEISIHDENADLKYFIPKLCNIDMINALPGINKVDENSIGAYGMFTCSKDELPTKLVDFISRVPTDADIPRREVRNY